MQLQNTFEKGMLWDNLDFLTPDGTYRICLNGVHRSRNAGGFGIVNEESNELVCTLPGTIKGYSYIEQRDQSLFFVLKGNESHLYLFDHKTHKEKFVCSDKEFDCDWGFAGCEFLYGEFKQFNKCNELHVYWSSDCVYHVVNIDEMLNDKRKQNVKDTQDCDYFDVFRVTCGPHTSAVAVKNGGSTLEGGAIRFAVQFETNDRGVSHVFDVSQPVYLETENNIPGEISTMSARLTIENLDPEWNNVIIYVIHTVGQITTVKRMPSATYGENGFTFDYYGQTGEVVDVSTITNKSKAWLRGQDLVQKDGMLIFYNIKNEKNLNYQKYANQIELEWVEYEVSMEQQLKYHFPSLLRGEIYAFAIVWKYADGTYSSAFPIPAVPSSSSSGQAAKASSGPGSTNSSQYCSDEGGNCVECSYCFDDCQTCTPNEEGLEGNTTSGGEESPDEPVQAGYNPIEISDLDTSQQFERKRNPSERKDRPNESDKFEENVESTIDNVDTNEQSIIDAGECHDNLYGCDEAKTALEDDINDHFRPIEANTELLSEMILDDPDPDVNTTSSLKQAAQKLIDAVKNREYIKRKRPTLNYKQAEPAVSGETPGGPEEDLGTEEVEFSQTGVGKTKIKTPTGSRGTIRGDNWVDGMGNPITEQRPRVIARGKFEVYESVIEYPDDRDCNGDRFFPEGKITFPKVPRSPHFVSYQNGVVNKYQPDNYEYAKTFTRPIGLKVDNIKFPNQNDLPKPLCPTSPFKIVYVKRTHQNKTIFAKAWLSGIFTGDVYGETQAFERHGVNSFERVNRFIAAGDDGFSRLGSQSDAPVYMAHSPDLDCDVSFLPLTKVWFDLRLKGSGWKHGDYAEGQKPQNQFTGKRRDQAGTRISNNINHYDVVDGETDVKGFSYAPANSILTKPPGMQYTLNNRYGASALYIETEDRCPGDERDRSFIGATLEHFFPLQCNAPYVSLGREVPDLYGSVDGLKYIDLGLVATQVHAMGTKAIEGICGDTWIGPYSKRKTSYVSNKKGDFFNVPAKDGSPCRERSWCDSPDDKVIEYMGIDFYPTKLPISGDIYDPKNYAGLHTVAGACGENGRSKTAAEAAAVMDSESDFYGPGVLKGLVHCVIESHVNPWLMQTGAGSQLNEGKVYYPKLKDLYLDAEAPNKHPWEKSFLTRFYKLIEQPSKSMLMTKAFIRTALNLLVPAGTLLGFQDLESILDVVATMATTSMINAFWVLAVNLLFTDKRLNQMLGISECLRDEEGGDFEESIENFEDAYTEYCYHYSEVNDIESYYTFSLPYNTCDCSACDKSKTNLELYYADKQNLDSEIDAWRTVRMNNYKELPANGGKLGKVFSLNGGLYAHTSLGFWLLRTNNDSFSQQIAYQQSGSGEWFSDPQLLFEGVEGGFAGTMHPNAGIITPDGYYFIDDKALKVYRFTGNMPEEISALGMQTFFEEHLKFCNPKACYDEKTEFGIHYALGYDPINRRLLLTKQDGNASFTISYLRAGEMGKWVSFHSYKPQAYLWDRQNMYSILTGQGQIWKHGVKNNYQNFYGKSEPFMIEFTANKPPIQEFTFESLRFTTLAEKFKQGYFVKDLDVTFNKLAVWNSTQGTGLLEIVPVPNTMGTRQNQQDTSNQNYSEVKFNKFGRSWNANAIKDLRIDCSEEPLLIKSDCQVIPDINQTLFDCNVVKTQGNSNRLFSDNFLTFRYILDDRNDIRLNVVRHIVNDNIKQ